MASLSSSLAIPDSSLAKGSSEILREYSTDVLINHSIRVYLFAAEQGRQQNLRFDAELLYVASAFHDLGLIKKFSSQNERFEVDGANAARQFLTAHNVPEEQVQTVWEAIALHTTPGVTQYMRLKSRSSTLASVSMYSEGRSINFHRSNAMRLWRGIRARISSKTLSGSTSQVSLTSQALPTAQ